MKTGTIAGMDYYNPQTFAGAVRCVDCVCEQYGEAAFEKLDTMPEAYDAGRPVSEGNARLGLPADTCNECDTCARPVCRGVVCGACGFAPGCEKHDEGHHPSCSAGELLCGCGAPAQVAHYGLTCDQEAAQ